MPSPGSQRRAGLIRRFPEPARFWVGFSPRIWPVAAGPWTDPGGNRLSGLSKRREGLPAEIPRLDAAALEETLYLPPIAADFATERDRWAAELIESETPVRLGLVPGELGRVAGAAPLYDLLPTLLASDLEGLAQLPRGSDAVWPLIPELTDRREMWEQGCSLLAASGVRTVQPLAVDLSPEDRRLLAELGDETAFDALFHGRVSSERDFSRCAASYGLAFFVERQAAPMLTSRRARNRHIATSLARAGELWLRLGRTVSGGQGLIRAARGAESSRFDLIALTSEDNLAVLDWLDARSRALVCEVINRDRSSLLDELEAEYLQE